MKKGNAYPAKITIMCLVSHSHSLSIFFLPKFSSLLNFISSCSAFILINRTVGGQGAGARENGGGRREGKGREAGVLRGREAGEKCKTLMFVIY